MTNLDLVRNFHLIFNRPIRSVPTMIPLNDRWLRLDLIEEELDELHVALQDGKLVDAADAIADLLYVVYGTAVEMGLDANALVQEVHRANMSKLDENGKAILREDGKVLKGPNYKPPDIKGVLNG
jgi:predicted HAD superfamily Cof-like phosphohydrolase